MPVVPAEIMLSKILANGTVILVATGLSLSFVVEGWLQVPITGSICCSSAGSCVYVFTVAALGIPSRYGRFDHGPVRPAVDPGHTGHDVAFRHHHPDGKHAWSGCNT